MSTEAHRNANNKATEGFERMCLLELLPIRWSFIGMKNVILSPQAKNLSAKHRFLYLKDVTAWQSLPGEPQGWYNL